MTDASDWVHENSVAYLTVKFYDKNNSLASPSSGTWQVHDIYSGTVMKAPTYITPIASSVELTLTTPINTFIDPNSGEETRRVTVRAFFADGECWDEYDYNVVGLSYAP
jgi:hypothetical protein